MISEKHVCKVPQKLGMRLKFKAIIFHLRIQYETIIIENVDVKKKSTHDYFISSLDTQILNINKNLSSEYKIIFHEQQ